MTPTTQTVAALSTTTVASETDTRLQCAVLAFDAHMNDGTENQEAYDRLYAAQRYALEAFVEVYGDRWQHMARQLLADCGCPEPELTVEFLAEELGRWTEPAAGPVQGTGTPLLDALVEQAEQAVVADTAALEGDNGGDVNPEQDAKDGAGMANSAATRVGRVVGKRLYAADCNTTKVRVQCGETVHRMLVAEHANTGNEAGAWSLKRQACTLGVEAAILEESGLRVKLNELVGMYHAAKHCAELLGMTVDQWCRTAVKGKPGSGVTFTVCRELIPLVDRNPVDETWALKAHIGDAVRTLAAKVHTGRLAADTVKAEVAQLQAAHYRAVAAEAAAAAAVLPDGPDKAAALKDAERATARADKLLTPKAARDQGSDKADGPVGAPADQTPAPAAPVVVAPVPENGTGEDQLEAALRAIGGTDENASPAPARTRAMLAYMLLGHGTAGGTAFVDLLAENGDDELADAMMTAFVKRHGAKLNAVIRREMGRVHSPA